MHSPEIMAYRNEMACRPRINHPKLHALAYTVQRLAIGSIYRAALLRSIDRYAQEIIDRPHYEPNEGWDDLEALQQVTLANMMEAAVRGRCQ